MPDDELWSRFAAEPGAAYPFGFDPEVRIYVDPDIYEEEWLLLRLVLPTETVQVRGVGPPKVFTQVANPVEEVITFNLTMPRVPRDCFREWRALPVLSC